MNMLIFYVMLRLRIHGSEMDTIKLLSVVHNSLGVSQITGGRDTDNL